jgi:hypothetical protein
MYDVEATVTETAPTLLKLAADWPVDWLRETGIRTMEIMHQLLHGEILELPWVTTQRGEIEGNRTNWRKLYVGNRVLVRCFFPGERTSALRLADEPRQLLPVISQAPYERPVPARPPSKLSA